MFDCGGDIPIRQTNETFGHRRRMRLAYIKHVIRSARIYYRQCDGLGHVLDIAMSPSPQRLISKAVNSGKIRIFLRAVYFRETQNRTWKLTAATRHSLD